MAIATVSFISNALQRAVTISVILPQDKMCLRNKTIPARKPLKTLYYLEGATGNYATSLYNTLIKPMAEDHNLCVVLVSGDNKWYGDSDISGDYYGKFIREDLITFTRDTFNLSPKREDTFIGGFSMGGFGSAVLGLRHPDIFSHIILVEAGLNKQFILDAVDESPNDKHTRTQYSTMFGLKDTADFAGSTLDYEMLAEQVAQKKELMPKFLVVCGDRSLPRARNEKFRDKLLELGYDATLAIVPGGHSWSTTLNSGFAKAMDWLPLEGFGDNMPMAGEKEDMGWDEYMYWEPYYNIR